MSKTYKLAVFKDNVTKKDKRMASKAVRRYKGVIQDGMFYKKIYCSYDIHDFIFDSSYVPIDENWTYKPHIYFEKNGRTYQWAWESF